MKILVGVVLVMGCAGCVLFNLAKRIQILIKIYPNYNQAKTNKRKENSSRFFATKNTRVARVF